MLLATLPRLHPFSSTLVQVYTLDGSCFSNLIASPQKKKVIDPEDLSLLEDV